MSMIVTMKAKKSKSKDKGIVNRINMTFENWGKDWNKMKLCL